MSARRAVPEESRRGWCPSLARPMPTGDGLLARVHPPLGVLGVAQMRAVAEGARRFGNGHVDVTGRANLQIRGVRPETASGLAALLNEAGLGDVRADGGPQRLTLTSPLAGLEPCGTIDVPALARAIEAGGLRIAALPAKTLVAIEGIGVSGAGADIVVRPEAGGRVAVSVAGGDEAVAVAARQAAGAVTALLRAFAATGRRRVRDLSIDERGDLFRVMKNAACRIGLAALPSPRARGEGRDDPVVGAASPKGEGEGAVPDETPAAAPPHPRLPPRLADHEVGKALSPRTGRGDAVSTAQELAAGLAAFGALTILAAEAPFGRCTAEALDRLADAARTLAAADIRLTPSRGFVLTSERGDAGAPALETLAAAGFVTHPDDPRRALAACPGAPACAAGSTSVPAHAARLARAFAPFAARGRKAHVSGCAKGCAHPGRADLTLVAEDGRYRVVTNGSPGEPSVARLTFEAAVERVRSADPAEPLARAFRT